MDLNSRVDLTTPAGIQAEMARLVKMISGNCPYASIVISQNSFSLVVEDDLLSGKKIARIKANSFEEMIEKAETEIKAWKIRNVETDIRKLALAIIETTDEHTHCTAALLRAKGFSANQITEYHVAACARASEMCANSPFVVEGL